MCQVFAMEQAMAINQDERAFFVALGKRITQLRKDNHFTQVQLAQSLGVSQSAMNAYEQGQRRVPVSALPTLALALGIGLEALLGASTSATRKRGPAPKLAQHMEHISQLPKPKQRFVMQVLESVLAQAGR
jgi:transcriptional regulator with XRE-family HTH domain